MPYIYETHMHTCQGSACGVSTGKEQAQYYKEIGYTGIIITDHFFHGNTAVPRDLPWEERIDLFFRGFEDAREEGEKIGLDVFFSYEQNFAGDEYLVYGLDKAYMKAHPEMERWTRRQQMEEVHKAGGCVIQAHPFRMRNYMDKIRLGAQFCDGIEVANAGNEAVEDARAIGQPSFAGGGSLRSEAGKTADLHSGLCGRDPEKRADYAGGAGGTLPLGRRLDPGRPAYRVCADRSGRKRDQSKTMVWIKNSRRYAGRRPGS